MISDKFNRILTDSTGIPEVKCFLNGLNIPRVVRVKTLMYAHSQT